MTSRVPTVEDLRVKLCYICREEELYDDRSDPPTPWTHPCQCTLVAHEACLLKWIQTSQGTSARAAVNSLKCPQCGAQYELESKHPVLLKFLATGNKALQQLGRLFTLFGVATFVGVVSSGVYIIMTGYGAWALKKFIGKEMFDLLLTADPANWPYAAYFNLPLMSISLVLSRLQNTSSIPAIIPILLLWPPSPPVKVRQQLLQEYWTNPSNARRLAMSALPAPAIAWPPSPFAVGLFFIPLARNLYRILYAKLALWVLGAKAASLLPSSAMRMRRNVANVRRNGNGGHEEREQQQQQHAGQGHQNQQGEGVRQVVWQWNIFPLMVRIRANVGEVIQQEGDNNDNAPNGNAQQAQEPNGPVVADPNANNANAPEEGNPAVAAAVIEAAEQQIEVNTTSLGRQIGGALLIPAISSWMGSILLRLSWHSGLLRDFLAIKHTAMASGGGTGGGWWNIGSWSSMMGGNAGGMPGGMLLFPSLPPPPLGQWSYSSWEGLSPWDQVKLALKLTLQSAWGGTRTWAESDPVWWRNSIGLGLFVVARDCLQLLHLWLTKRELETRRVKNRDFAGVDVDELDLIPSWSDRT
ncbi:hypothetical protein JOM56_011442 [Amanita muscaria]